MTLRQQQILNAAIQCAADVYGIDPVTKSRATRACWARTAVYVELRKFNMGYGAVGKPFGRDHATVLHSVKKHVDNLTYDQEYRELYNKYRALAAITINDKKFTRFDLHDQVLHINNELLNMGYSWDDIEDFWKESINAARNIKTSA